MAGPPAAPITVAPRRRAYWMTSRPIPPAADVTSTTSPGVSAATSR
ncbi:hypothetical protein ACFQES_12360 [Nonomuraea salmonea]